MQIHTLRVNRKEVGKQFPFDRVYLVKHDDRGVIEQLFRCALVMPVDDNLRKMLLELNLEEVVERTFERDDEAQTPRQARQKELTKLLKGDWVLVLPVLTKWLRGKNLPAAPAADPDADGNGKLGPRYLTSPKWLGGKKRGEERKKNSFLPSLAYLQVPGRKIRPICVACPQRIMQENGQCHLGEPQCYTQLSLGVQNYFKSGMQSPITPNIKEMLADGFVPEDVA
jgi:hypothetical protein